MQKVHEKRPAAIVLAKLFTLTRYIEMAKRKEETRISLEVAVVSGRAGADQKNH
jgi:hypothetical protein